MPVQNYTMQEIVNKITELQQTDPAAAYALYNGVSGMGGGVADPGAVTTALREAWGKDAASKFVNEGTVKYGNTMMDPSTGEWAGMGQAGGMKGSIAGWNPAQWDPTAQYGGGGVASQVSGGGGATRPGTGVTSNPLAKKAMTDPEQNIATTALMGRPGGMPSTALPTRGTPVQQPNPRGSVYPQEGTLNGGSGSPGPTRPGGTPNPGQTPTPGAGNPNQAPGARDPAVFMKQLQALMAGAVNAPGGSGQAPGPSRGPTPYTPYGNPLRSFDPSYLIQANREHFKGKSGAGQTFTPPQMPAQHSSPTNQVWQTLYQMYGGQ